MNKNFCTDAMLSLLLILFLSTYSDTVAAKNCERYAREAVSHNQQNRDEKCNYSGLSWHDNYGAHLGWCLIAPAKLVRKEKRKRSKAITDCLLSQGPGGSALPGLQKKQPPTRRRSNSSKLKRMSKKACRGYAAKMERLQRKIEDMCGRPPQGSSFKAQLNYCRKWPVWQRRANADASLNSERMLLKQGRCL